jgi:hypothetical protein
LKFLEKREKKTKARPRQTSPSFVCIVCDLDAAEMCSGAWQLGGSECQLARVQYDKALSKIWMENFSMV